MKFTKRESDKLFQPELRPYCLEDGGRYVCKVRFNNRTRTGNRYDTITECNDAHDAMLKKFQDELKLKQMANRFAG